MKAVVWTDVFQSLVMISGLLAIVIQVLYSVHSMTVLCHAVKRVGGSNFLYKCYKCYKLWMSPRSRLRFVII